MEKAKIVVETSGGVVTAVHCNIEADVQIVDFDELDDLRQARKFSDVEDFEERHELLTDGLAQVW